MQCAFPLDASSCVLRKSGPTFLTPILDTTLGRRLSTTPTGQLSQIFIGSYLVTKFAAWVDRHEAAAQEAQRLQEQEQEQEQAGKGGMDGARAHDEEGKAGVGGDEEQEVVDGVLEQGF